MDFVWSLRNKVVREDYKLSMEELGRGVMRKFREHWMIMSQDSSCSSSPSSEDTHWVRPDNGVIKLNFDAAIGLNDSAVAVVARNWRGRLVFAVSSRVDTNIPVQAEAEAIRLAAITALKHNIPLAIFQSDSKVCVQSLNSSILVVPWRIANVVKESKAIACLFNSAKFIWAPRKSNMAAHSLAQWSISNRMFGYFVYSSAPPSLLDVIQEEASFVSLS